MKKVVIPIVCVLLVAIAVACAIIFIERTWEDSQIKIFNNKYAAWAYDIEAKDYLVYIDGEKVASAPNCYFALPFDDDLTHTVSVVKKKGLLKYRSQELTFSKDKYSNVTIKTEKELLSYLSNDRYQIGSLKYDKLTLDFSGLKKTSFDFKHPFNVASTLKCLYIKGGVNLNLTSFSVVLEERKEPFTLIFENACIESSVVSTVSYSGKTEFPTELLITGTCSFTNTTKGMTGNKGHDDKGYGTRAGTGETGGVGGSVIDLPVVNAFLEDIPAILTGPGGIGGIGGNTLPGFLKAYGGHGGRGGQGGCFFYAGTVICFNSLFTEVSGSFGQGGEGGIGGFGRIEGNGRTQGDTGAVGPVGSFASENTTFTYLSRTDGVGADQNAIPSGNVGFNASIINNYILWNQQEGAEKYEILVDNKVIATTDANAYHINNIENVINSAIRIRAIIGDKTKYSKVARYYAESDGVIISTPTSKLTGEAHFILDASLLSGINTLDIASDVKRVTIKSDSDAAVDINTSIVANSRKDSLILDLYNVNLHGKAKDVISFNNGAGASLEEDPMLIINSFNSQIIASNGAKGGDGTIGTGLIDNGGNGGKGTNGGVGINASLVVLAGEGLTVKGGKGGDGGNGGLDLANNGGNGGDGGNGGIALFCSYAYILLNNEKSTITVLGGDAGNGGQRGEAVHDIDKINTAVNGKPGAKGAKTSGVIINIVGSSK